MAGTDTERKDEDVLDSLPRIPMLDARDRMTELVDLAMRGEPQILTRYNRDTVVLLRVEDYARLKALELSAA